MRPLGIDGVWRNEDKDREAAAIRAGYRRLMVDLRCARPCGKWLGGVFDSRWGAVLYLLWRTRPDQPTPETVVREVLLLLELQGTEGATAKCIRHGVGALDEPKLFAALADYRRSGRSKVLPVQISAC